MKQPPLVALPNIKRPIKPTTTRTNLRLKNRSGERTLRAKKSPRKLRRETLGDVAQDEIDAVGFFCFGGWWGFDGGSVRVCRGHDLCLSREGRAVKEKGLAE